MFKEFLKHLFPRMVLKNNLKLSYTFCLGGLGLSALIVSISTGVLMLFYYEPSVELAYGSILFLEENVFLGKYIRSVHRFSSNVFLVLIFLHTLRVLLTGAFIARSYNWVIGMVLLVLVIFEGYTGYLLPMDQLAFWATQTGMQLLETIALGEYVVGILTPDGVIGNLTLLRFYAFHIVITPMLIVIFVSIHLFRVRRDKGVLPYL